MAQRCAISKKWLFQKLNIEISLIEASTDGKTSLKSECNSYAEVASTQIRHDLVILSNDDTYDAVLNAILFRETVSNDEIKSIGSNYINDKCADNRREKVILLLKEIRNINWNTNDTTVKSINVNSNVVRSWFSLYRRKTRWNERRNTHTAEMLIFNNIKRR